MIIKIKYIRVWLISMLMCIVPNLNAQQQDSLYLNTIDANNITTIIDSVSYRTLDSLLQQMNYLKEENKAQVEYITVLETTIDSIKKEGVKNENLLKVLSSYCNNEIENLKVI